MEQDAGPAGAENHLHLAGRSGHGAELQNRSARGLPRQVFRAFGADELVQAGTPAAARRAFGGVCVFLGDDEDVQPAERLGVAGESAVRGGDEDAAQLLGVAGPDLHNAWIEGACGPVGSQDQFQPRGQVQIVAAQRNGIEIGYGGLDEALHQLFGRP